MANRLPPQNGLRAFEKAGRYLSFSKAAEELYATPAAISHQIKALEDHLGVYRPNQALVLTESLTYLTAPVAGIVVIHNSRGVTRPREFGGSSEAAILIVVSLQHYY